MQNKLYTKDLVLAGGGHAHVLAIKALAMRPIEGVRVTLVSEHSETPYSGMLPGYVAGHYQKEDTLIDLNRLCRAADVRWIAGRVDGIQTRDNLLQVKDQPAIAYDCLSLDTGSSPSLNSIKGAEFSVGVKPIAEFHRQWHVLQQLLDSTPSQENKDSPLSVGVIGAGIGGVELCLALAYRLKNLSSCSIHLLHSGDRILSELPDKAAALAIRQLHALGVSVHSGFRVREIDAHGVHSEAGQYQPLTHKFVCTQAGAPDWPGNSGLQVSDAGFVEVNKYLQSCSHGNIFAAGDLADMRDSPRSKAGVFAVRQAPFLVENFRRFFAEQALQPIKLQTDFLRLISLGEKKALACRNGLTLSGAAAWRLKHRIDQRFMQQFVELADSSAAMDGSAEIEPMHCAGCGSKLGPGLLQDNLNSLSENSDTAGLQAAVSTIEDASLWTVDASTVVQSIDGFRSFTSDLYRFGRISVNHAVNDVYAMGAEPVHAQVWANVRFAHPRLQQRDHLRLMSGVSDALQESGASLSGGHSTEGEEDHLGVVVNGLLPNANFWSKKTLKSGDVLCISKPLGTGVVLAADAALAAPPAAVDAAMQSMLRSNAAIFKVLRECNPNAVTDVSGFGLLGHVIEMLADDECLADLYLHSMPALPGALELLRGGYRSSLQPALLAGLNDCDISGKQALDNERNDPLVQLLLDPQTSGGFLFAIAEEQANRLCASNADIKRVGRIRNRETNTYGVHLHFSEYR